MEFNAYYFIIGMSLVIILSYLFNIIAKKTSIPSVLMLIILGVLMHPLFSYFGVDVLNSINFLPYLEVLGTVGLIKIVLEAALDLNLRGDKVKVITKSFAVAFFGLFATTAAIAAVFYYALGMDFHPAVIYAIPLSVISSAIVIPSISNLTEYKREFLIYESAFSDILGIMLFFFYIESLELPNASSIATHIAGSIGLTVFVAIIVSYFLVWVFQKIDAHVKFFLLFAFLLLLYSLGKLAHLSPLLIVLFFGLIINNYKIFFAGFLQKWIDNKMVEELLEELKMMTAELAFLVRTFFFVIFGLSISLSSLLDVSVIIVSVVILAVLYLIRALCFTVSEGKEITPQTYISPRGLITILLFFAIPEEYKVQAVDESLLNGIILFVIIVTGVIMTIALIKDSKNIEKSESIATIISEDEIIDSEKTDAKESNS